MGASIYEMMSANLFALCATHGSIAEVCRQTGINRQQFNKYLAGNTFPSKETLTRLATFFKVDETELIMGKPVVVPEATRLPYQEIVMDELRAGGRRCELKVGYYAAYLPWLANPGIAARTTIVISELDGLKMFTRLFRQKPPRMTGGFGPNMRADGVAIQVGQQIMLLGKEHRSFNHFYSAVSVASTNRPAADIWTGVSSTLAPSGIATSFSMVMIREPSGVTLKQSLAECGLRPLAELPQRYRDIVENNPEFGASGAKYSLDTLKNWRPGA
jgi:transcriptional regulator with XRE-family HTH domain